MATLTRQQVEDIIKKAPKGTDPEKVVRSILDRGYEIEGLGVQPTTPIKNPSLNQRVMDAGTKVTNLLGGRNVAETFGAEIAKIGASPEERQIISQDQPGVKETIGSALSLGSVFAPVGRIAQGVARGAKALGFGASKMIGNVAAGGATGAAADIGMDMSEGRSPTLGLGTLLGAGIPAASPVAQAIGRASTKYLAEGASEIQGVITGTSADTIEQAFLAARAGGKDLDQFTAALRGKTTPEALVNSVRQNIATIASKRQALFKDTLAELGDQVVSTAPAKSALLSKLKEAGITISDTGFLNFDQSKLKLVPAAQTKLQTAWQEVSNLPERADLASIDTTRQALKALSQAGEDPSANLANKLLDDAVRGVRAAGEQVDGYGKMLDNFAETSDFLDELERDLASGEKKTIDQTYRRIITSLKTNNERRMALVKELDAATDGALMSAISGQQLSENLTRGIFRSFAVSMSGALGGTGFFLGGPAGATSFLLPLLVSSPRVTGEFVRALGIGSQKADVLIKAIGDVRSVLIKAGAIGGANAEIDGDE